MTTDKRSFIRYVVGKTAPNKFIPLLVAFFCVWGVLRATTGEDRFRQETGFTGESEFNARGHIIKLAGQFSEHPVHSLVDLESKAAELGKLVEPWLQLPPFERFELSRVQTESPDIIHPGYVYVASEYVGYVFRQKGHATLPVEQRLQGSAVFRYDHQSDQLHFWNNLVYLSYPEAPLRAAQQIMASASGWLNLPVRDTLRASLCLRDITVSPSGNRPYYRDAGYFWEVSDAREYLLIDDRNGKIVYKQFNRPPKIAIPRDTLAVWSAAVVSRLPWPVLPRHYDFWQDGSLGGLNAPVPEALQIQNLALPALLDSLASALIPLIFPGDIPFIRTMLDEASGHARWHPEPTLCRDPNLAALSLDIFYGERNQQHWFRVECYRSPYLKSLPAPALSVEQAMDAVSKICLNKNYGSMEWFSLRNAASRKFQKNKTPSELTVFARQPLYLTDQGRSWLPRNDFTYNVYSRPNDFVLAWKITYDFSDFSVCVEATTGKVLHLNYDLYKYRM